MNKNLKCESPQNQECPKSGESEQKQYKREIAFMKVGK